MTKLLKFKKFLNMEETIELLSYLINEEVSIIEINDLMLRGFITAYSHKYSLLVEVEETKDHIYKITNNNTNLVLPLVPNLNFSYFHLEYGKICILNSAKNKKQYALVDEQGNFIDDCIEKENRRLIFFPSDIYNLAEKANTNKAIEAKYGKQKIPVDVFDLKNNKYIDHLSFIYYYNYDKDELADYNQKTLNKKVSENTQLTTIGLLIELLTNGERCPKQETIIDTILTKYPKIHGISRTTLANLFSDANKQLIEAIKK